MNKHPILKLFLLCLIGYVIFTIGFILGQIQNQKSSERLEKINSPDCSRCPSTMHQRSYIPPPLPTMIDFEPPPYPEN